MENMLILTLSLGMMYVHNKLVEAPPTGTQKNWGDLFPNFVDSLGIFSKINTPVIGLSSGGDTFCGHQAVLGVNLN